MPRLRIMAYTLVAAVILVCSLLWSGVIASPVSSGDLAPQWGQGPGGETIPPTVNLTVNLQRPNSPAPSLPWAVPVTLSFYTPGADPAAAPLYQFVVNLDNSGKWSGPLDMPQGTYDVRVRNLHTLRNVRRSVVIGASNNLDMATLYEGDANADNKVGAPDFSILRAAYFSNEPTPPWDPRADFDEDNKIRSSDFALLSLNYFKGGDIDVPLVAAASNAASTDKFATSESQSLRKLGRIQAADGAVALALMPRINRAAPGQIVTLTLTAQAGDQPFTAADAEISFAPDKLQVVDAAGNPATSVEVLAPFAELINRVDNEKGAILVGGGKFGTPVSGDVAIARLHFKVMKAGAGDVKLVDCTVSDQNGKFVTGSLYGAQIVPLGYTSVCLPIVSKAP